MCPPEYAELQTLVGLEAVFKKNLEILGFGE
jgi:hypothetical protein